MSKNRRSQLRGGACTSDECQICFEPLEPENPDDERRPYVRIPIGDRSRNLESCYHSGELRRWVINALNQGRFPTDPLTRQRIPASIYYNLIQSEEAQSDERVAFDEEPVNLTISTIRLLDYLRERETDRQTIEELTELIRIVTEIDERERPIRPIRAEIARAERERDRDEAREREIRAELAGFIERLGTMTPVELYRLIDEFNNEMETLALRHGGHYPSIRINRNINDTDGIIELLVGYEDRLPVGGIRALHHWFYNQRNVEQNGGYYKQYRYYKKQYKRLKRQMYGY